MMNLTWLAPAAFVAGSINFALILLKLLGTDDPRTRFSGNPGVTNVYRLAGVFWATIVLLLDVGRAVGVAVLALWLIPPEHVPWVGLPLILGNRFPLFHGFRGGKGVANYLGFTAALSPVAAGVSALGWVALFSVVRIPFIASFLMTFGLGLGIAIWAQWHPSAVAATIVTAGLIYVNHWGNIVRLRAERRGRKAKE